MYMHIIKSLKFAARGLYSTLQLLKLFPAYSSCQNFRVEAVKQVVGLPYIRQYFSFVRTRKPCYRKDDRAMRPIHGCPEDDHGTQCWGVIKIQVIKILLKIILTYL